MKSSPDHAELNPLRLEGFKAGMAAHGLKAAPELLVESAAHVDGGAQAARRLLALPPHQRPTALITFSPVMARGAIQAIRRLAPLGLNCRSLREYALHEGKAKKYDKGHVYSLNFLVELATDYFTLDEAMGLLKIIAGDSTADLRNETAASSPFCACTGSSGSSRVWRG